MLYNSAIQLHNTRTVHARLDASTTREFCTESLIYIYVYMYSWRKKYLALQHDCNAFDQSQTIQKCVRYSVKNIRLLSSLLQSELCLGIFFVSTVFNVYIFVHNILYTVRNFERRLKLFLTRVVVINKLLFQKIIFD